VLKKEGNGEIPGAAIAGGAISGNSASSGRGAGIYVRSGDFFLSENPLVTDAVFRE
jgi:hypothetical protein